MSSLTSDRMRYVLFVVIYCALMTYYHMAYFHDSCDRPLINRKDDCALQCNTTSDHSRICECETVRCLEIMCECTAEVYDIVVVADRMHCRNHIYEPTVCTASEVEAIASVKPIANSNCPDNRQWMRVALEHTDPHRSVVLVSVGCNTGDDLLNSMHIWTRNSSYDVTIDRNLITGRACPIFEKYPFAHEGLLPRPASAFCIEPLSSNAQWLRTLMAPYLSNIHVIHAAVSATSGNTSFPVGAIGTESYGIGTEAPTYEIVPVIQLDELQEQLGETIDLLSIDAEGHDMKVLEGASSILGRVRFLEFEYHKVNLWATTDLRALVEGLQNQYGFVCYWQGNQGQLWQLSGCWHDTYYSDRFWSNIVCVNAKLAPHAALAFERLALLPQRTHRDGSTRVHYSEEYIRTLWDHTVKKPDHYFKRSEIFITLFQDLGIDFQRYGQLTVDVSRVMILLDFVTWIQMYNITRPNKVLTTFREDPEMNFIQPNDVVEYRYHQNANDLHLLDKDLDIPTDFDLILFAQTLEHLWDPLLAVRNLFGKLRPGGYIFTSVPTLNFQHMTPYHFQHFTPMGLAMLFVNAGFEVVELGQWGNLEYETKILSTLTWPTWRELSQPIINEREHPSQCWILARKPAL